MPGLAAPDQWLDWGGGPNMPMMVSGNGEWGDMGTTALGAMEDTESPACPDDDFDPLIRQEWLITNGRGGFASGTALGIPTRRYHGLLVAAARPPLERWMMLSAVLERIGVSGRYHEMAAFEFDHIIHPTGYQHRTDFAVRNTPPDPWVRFAYAHDGMTLTKQVVLPHGRDEVSVRYRLEGPPGERLHLELLPFLALRDFHGLTRAFPGIYPIQQIREFVTVDAYRTGPRLWMSAQQREDRTPVTFEQRPDWWYGIRYREESARGLEDHEDLFVPGCFRAEGTGVIEVEFRAVADFTSDLSAMPAPRPALTPVSPPSITPQARPVEDRLREAAQAFVVARQRDGNSELTTILAGCPWFGDWGRDTFIALPGLLLETERFAEAQQVLEVFASAQQDGLIPNRFSDYGDGRDYNSVDASLWFIHAADAYVTASGDQEAWPQVLGPACQRIVDAFIAGTRFGIHVTDDGLVNCGDASTQLTWMDAKCGNEAFTPRHGKPVEINALWYHGLCVMAKRARSSDPDGAARYRELAERARHAFVDTFWYDDGKYLYDVVRDRWGDPAVRPNQIFAVSLPNSPLDRSRQREVLNCVEQRLLTPYGQRSLCPRHPAYCGRYQGGPYQRDRVYHQGTVWAWLIGPYVEAWLRVHDFSAAAKAKMRQHLQPLVDHLDDAGIGSISEIFDGDAPHTPRGSIAQAWSVAELLRAWRMTT